MNTFNIVFGLAVTIIIAVVAFQGYCVYKVVDTVSEAGGIENVIVDFGKDVKRIGERIEND